MPLAARAGSSVKLANVKYTTLLKTINNKFKLNNNEPVRFPISDLTPLPRPCS